MGRKMWSLRGDQSWQGISRQSSQDRGAKRLVRLDGGYVSSDGQEIRMFPGMRHLVDLTAENNPRGTWDRPVLDATLPVYRWATPTNGPFIDQFVERWNGSPGGEQLTMWSRAKPAHFHGFEQINGQLIIWGESRYRENPILGPSRRPVNGGGMNVLGLQVGGSGDYWWAFNFGPDLASATPTDRDADGAGMNGLVDGMVVTFSGFTPSDGDADDQADFDQYLNGKTAIVHNASSVSGGRFYIYSQCPASWQGRTVSASSGEVHVVRRNVSSVYSTPSIPSVYDATVEDRPNDPDALTSWRVLDGLSLQADDQVTCYPAWVANRQRDFGDEAGQFLHSESIGITEGPAHDQVSLREQRKLPYRTNAAPATDRLILAAPGYGCLFQIPLMANTDPSAWIASPAATQLPSSRYNGIPGPPNSVYDKPRALGVPKARLILGEQTLAQPSPTDWTSGNYDTSILAVNNVAGYGYDPGTYRFTITYEDEVTGEEGLAAEPIEIVIPSGYSWGLTPLVNYILSSVVMPESLAFKINTYVTLPDGTALRYYGSFSNEHHDVHSTPQYVDRADSIGRVSAVYGSVDHDIFRSMSLWPRHSPDDSNSVRLAPRGANMPRGAEAASYVRGFLISGGSLGNAGPNDELWAHRARIYPRPSFNHQFPTNHIIIRAHEDGGSYGSPGGVRSPVGQVDRGGSPYHGIMGNAGGFFPDAYQGVYCISPELFGKQRMRQQIDIVDNHRCDIYPHIIGQQRNERMRTVDDVFNNSRPASQNPASTQYGDADGAVFFVLPRGQVQISDPGAPHRASKTSIQVVDPVRGDDIKAIGQFNGQAIICSQKETYTLSFYRTPLGEVPSLASSEHGCIAGNSMVEFDGGIAWIGERGPVAMMGGEVMHVGADVSEMFYADANTRNAGYSYSKDRKGMMRHTWGAHDKHRHLVMWGMVTSDATHTLSFEGGDYSWQLATDQIRSRFACNEVLIWSYRSNSFSTWRPPSGSEIYWMRPLTLSDGSTYMSVLCSDGKIYALDDTFNDRNGHASGFNSYGPETNPTFGVHGFTPSSSGSGTTLSLMRVLAVTDGDYGSRTLKSDGFYLKPGMLVEFIDEHGRLVSDTTISSITVVGDMGTDTVVELSDSSEWEATYTVRIGGRKMTIVSSFHDAADKQNITLDSVQMRYTAVGDGDANVHIQAIHADISRSGVSDNVTTKVVDVTKQSAKPSLNKDATTDSPSQIPDDLYGMVGQRRTYNTSVASPEVAIKATITGNVQIRIQDLMMEMS